MSDEADKMVRDERWRHVFGMVVSALHQARAVGVTPSTEAFSRFLAETNGWAIRESGIASGGISADELRKASTVRITEHETRLDPKGCAEIREMLAAQRVIKATSTGLTSPIVLTDLRTGEPVALRDGAEVRFRRGRDG